MDFTCSTQNIQLESEMELGEERRKTMKTKMVPSIQRPSDFLNITIFV
jgi:hypothetical protein